MKITKEEIISALSKQKTIKSAYLKQEYDNGFFSSSTDEAKKTEGNFMSNIKKLRADINRQTRVNNKLWLGMSHDEFSQLTTEQFYQALKNEFSTKTDQVIEAYTQGPSYLIPAINASIEQPTYTTIMPPDIKHDGLIMNIAINPTTNDIEYTLQFKQMRVLELESNTVINTINANTMTVFTLKELAKLRPEADTKSLKALKEKEWGFELTNVTTDNALIIDYLKGKTFTESEILSYSLLSKLDVSFKKQAIMWSDNIVRAISYELKGIPLGKEMSPELLLALCDPKHKSHKEFLPLLTDDSSLSQLQLLAKEWQFSTTLIKSTLFNSALFMNERIDTFEKSLNDPLIAKDTSSSITKKFLKEIASTRNPTEAPSIFKFFQSPKSIKRSHSPGIENLPNNKPTKP